MDLLQSFYSMYLGGSRKEFIIEGRILRHEDRTTGWWIFRKDVVDLIIALDESALMQVKERFGGFIDLRGLETSIPSKIRIRTDKADHNSCEVFSRGTKVHVMFQYSDVLMQNFTGEAPLRICGLFKVEENGPYRSVHIQTPIYL